MNNPHESRVLAALDVLGWPDDRGGSAHVEDDGHEVTPAGHYWSLVEDVLRAADAASAGNQPASVLTCSDHPVRIRGSVSSGTGVGPYRRGGDTRA